MVDWASNIFKKQLPCGANQSSSIATNQEPYFFPHICMQSYSYAQQELLIKILIKNKFDIYTTNDLKLFPLPLAHTELIKLPRNPVLFEFHTLIEFTVPIKQSRESLD